MGTNECSQPTSKSSWDSQDFGDVSMVLKWPSFASPPGHNELNTFNIIVFYLHFHWSLFQSISNWQYIIIGSSDGLTPRHEGDKALPEQL